MLAVHGAVLTVRLSILADDEGIEEAAGRVGVSRCLGCASCRATASVKRLAIIPVLVAQVSGAAVAVIRGADCVATEIVRIRVASAVVDGLVDIAI